MAAPNTYNFTTGTSALPDVGVLSYNGCVFSPLYETKVSGKVVKDNANRTTKFMEYTLTADGYVTLPQGADDINSAMTKLRTLLTAQAGALEYTGRGFNLVINKAAGGANLNGPLNAVVGVGPNNNTMDVAWGPVPELIEFQPLGAGRSAKVQWKVVVRIPEVAKKSRGILQLNYDTVISYGEDGFSALSMSGTLEVAITRTIQSNRNLTYTVDDFRNILSREILNSIDLERFRVTNREFNVSRDRRTLEWSVSAEERPYMDMPPDCTVARGTYTVRPAKSGMGLNTWHCSLKATYTVRKGAWRRTAWLAFLGLLRVRMRASFDVDLPKLQEAQDAKPEQFTEKLVRGVTAAGVTTGLTGNPIIGFIAGTVALFVSSDEPAKAGIEKASRKVWLIDFSMDEGLYLDSKTITFSATWRLVADFKDIIVGSGLWRKVAEEDDKGRNLWAMSMANISGSQSWLQNKIDPSLDVIVDFGAEV